MSKVKKIRYAVASMWRKEGKLGEFWSGKTNHEFFSDTNKGLKLLATDPNNWELFLSVKTEKASENSPDATLFVQEAYKPAPKAAPKPERSKTAPAPAAAKEDVPW